MPKYWQVRVVSHYTSSDRSSGSARCVVGFLGSNQTRKVRHFLLSGTKTNLRWSVSSSISLSQPL